MASPTFSLGFTSLREGGQGTSSMSVGDDSNQGIDDNVLYALSEQLKTDKEMCHLMEELHLDIDAVRNEDLLRPNQVVVNVLGREPFEFLEEDSSFMKTIAEGGLNPSAAVDKWARNRLNKFRAYKGLDTSIMFDDLSALDCATLLTKFFSQVCKKDGSFYPTATLASLFRAFHSVLRRKQECRIQRTGVDEPVFNMRTSPLFKSVSVLCVLAMQRSKLAGANLPRKKAAIITLSDEHTILSHRCTARDHPRGLQRRAVYYLLCRFEIRGGQELYKLDKCEFQFGCDDGGKFVRYDERLSKNYKVSLEWYQDEHFCPALTIHEPDMVGTLQELIDHLPVSGTFLFYQCIDSPRSHAWYSTLRVSAKKLTGCMKEIHHECGLKVEGITNKSGRTTCVTRMVMEGVPTAIGMRITGHKSSGAYSRYDRSHEAQVRAAQVCANQGITYSECFVEEARKFKQNVILVSRQVKCGSNKEDKKENVPILNGNIPSSLEELGVLKSVPRSFSGVSPLTSRRTTTPISWPQVHSEGTMIKDVILTATPMECDTPMNRVVPTVEKSEKVVEKAKKNEKSGESAGNVVRATVFNLVKVPTKASSSDVVDPNMAWMLDIDWESLFHESRLEKSKDGSEEQHRGAASNTFYNVGL
ncbi:unnamed protein product [Calypogeia fissa]